MDAVLLVTLLSRKNMRSNNVIENGLIFHEKYSKINNN